MNLEDILGGQGGERSFQEDRSLSIPEFNPYRAVSRAHEDWTKNTRADLDELLRDSAVRPQYASIAATKLADALADRNVSETNNVLRTILYLALTNREMYHIYYGTISNKRNQLVEHNESRAEDGEFWQYELACLLLTEMPGEKFSEAKSNRDIVSQHGVIDALISMCTMEDPLEEELTEGSLLSKALDYYQITNVLIRYEQELFDISASVTSELIFQACHRLFVYITAQESASPGIVAFLISAAETEEDAGRSAISREILSHYDLLDNVQRYYCGETIEAVYNYLYYAACKPEEAVEFIEPFREWVSTKLQKLFWFLRGKGVLNYNLRVSEILFFGGKKSTTIGWKI